VITTRCVGDSDILASIVQHCTTLHLNSTKYS